MAISRGRSDRNPEMFWYKVRAPAAVLVMARLDSLLELDGRNGLEDLIRGKTEGFPGV